MTDQVQQLNSQINLLEGVIRERSAKLKVAQERWHDWEAGVLRAAIGRDQINLHNLRLRRESLSPPREMKASAIFYSSNS
jgi:hypothetical protein